MWDLVSEVLASSRRFRVLRALAVEPLDHRSLQRLTGLERSNAYKAIDQLRDRGLVECLTPERPRSKIYAITALGKEVFERTNGKWLDDNE